MTMYDKMKMYDKIRAKMAKNRVKIPIFGKNVQSTEFTIFI
jgi:hypothetical protein